MKLDESKQHIKSAHSLALSQEKRLQRIPEILAQLQQQNTITNRQEREFQEQHARLEKELQAANARFAEVVEHRNQAKHQLASVQAKFHAISEQNVKLMQLQRKCTSTESAGASRNEINYYKEKLREEQQARHSLQQQLEQLSLAAGAKPSTAPERQLRKSSRGSLRRAAPSRTTGGKKRRKKKL